MKKEVKTSNAPEAPGILSQAVVSGNLVFVSGQIHMTSDEKMVEGTIEEQTHAVMKNIGEILKEAGLEFDSVVKATIYVTNISLARHINDVYISYFSKPYPAREMIEVQELPMRARLEISVIASK